MNEEIPEWIWISDVVMGWCDSAGCASVGHKGNQCKLAVSFAAHLSRRPVTEAAPGGLRGSWQAMDSAPRSGESFLIRYPKQANTSALCYWVKVHNQWRSHGEVIFPESQGCEWIAIPSHTPAPNREAELKVIEAAKALEGQSCYCGYCEEHQTRACTGCKCGFKEKTDAMTKALASLAQSEMKGESK